MKNIFKTIGVLAAMVTCCGATVTLTFNSPFSQTGGVASGFANAASTPMNGLVWGVIVDTDNTGFYTSYDAFTPALNTVTVLGNMGFATTNVLITSQVGTTNLAGQFEFDGSFNQVNEGGDGGLSGVSDIAVDGTNGVNTGDKFRLVWFDPSGNSAGFIDDGSFILPADTSATDYSAIFRGPDAAKPATGIAIVPEPSTLLLSAFGALALLRRKR
ncbi:MAG: PEP-CTERM sorting domain-containing protein [Luteolibacter sp.]